MRAGLPQFLPQAGHFLAELFDFGEVFNAVVVLGKQSQIGQLVIVFVAVEVVNEFAWAEAPSKALCNDEAMFIDTPPVVRHS